MREFLDRFLFLPSVQLYDDAAANGAGRQPAAHHADRFRTERLELLRPEIRFNALHYALAACMAAVDDGTQRSFVVAGQHRVELVDCEAWLPQLYASVERGFADLH